MPELPIIYTVRLDLTDEVRDEFERWAAGKHIQDVLTHPGFMWARRVPLDEPAEDGWKKLMIVYGINSREDYLIYKNSDLFQQFKEECKQFEGLYRVQRYFGQVDLVLD